MNRLTAFLLMLAEMLLKNISNILWDSLFEVMLEGIAYAEEEFTGGEKKKDYVMDLKDALKTFTSEGPEGSTYKIYKDRNLLIARNTPENLRLIEKIVKNLDRAPRQVLIEARFITINREDLFSLGLNLENILIPASGTKAPF